jgi:hypothetical protein
MPMNPWHPHFSPYVKKNIPNMFKRDIGKLNPIECFRFIFYMYDIKSPIHEIPDLDWFGKKFEAAEAAGFELKKDKQGYLRFSTSVMDALLGKNEGFNDAIVDYLGWANSYEWTESVYLDETAMRYVKEALGGTRGDKTTIKAVQDIYERLAVLRKKMLFGNEDTEDLMRRIYHRIEESRLMIKPEDYARRLESGDDLSEDSPYGSNYVVGKIRFIGDKIPDGESE